MALGLAEQWTLVACGVMAHADGVMDGEECDRLMALVDDWADGDEYSDWLATIADPKRLEDLLDSLEPPDEGDKRDILEQAWMLAIVDGERSDEELEMLERIASKLGVESVQLEFWRTAWTEGQDAFAAAIAHTLPAVLAEGETPSEEDHKVIREVIWRLPTSTEQREALMAVALSPAKLTGLERNLAGLQKSKRVWLMKLLVPTVRAASDPAAAQARLEQLGASLGLSEDRIARIFAEA